MERWSDSAQAVDHDDPCLNIDCRDLYAWDKTLYAQLIDYPGEVIPLFDIETSAMASGWSGRDLEGAIRVRARVLYQGSACNLMHVPRKY